MYHLPDISAFELKIATWVNRVLLNIHTNFGLSAPFRFWFVPIRDRWRGKISSAGYLDAQYVNCQLKLPALFLYYNWAEQKSYHDHHYHQWIAGSRPKASIFVQSSKAGLRPNRAICCYHGSHLSRKSPKIWLHFSGPQKSWSWTWVLKKSWKSPDFC